MRKVPVLPALAADVVLVLAFAAGGIATHDDSLPAAFVRVAWPFLAGLAVGWVSARAWRDPARLPAGVIVWASTLLVGMALRTLSGQGTAASFVVVAAAFLAVTLLGWRALVTALRAAASRAASRD